MECFVGAYAFGSNGYLLLLDKVLSAALFSHLVRQSVVIALCA